MTIVYLIIFSCISAILYRMGGCSPEDLHKEWGWVPKFIRRFPKKRDVGCGIATLACAGLIGLSSAHWLLWVLAFGLLWASLSTYWDYLFGYDNHWFHGFVIGISLMPIVGLKSLVYACGLAVLMGAYSKIVGNATWEELGRGFFMPLTLSLMLL